MILDTKSLRYVFLNHRNQSKPFRMVKDKISWGQKSSSGAIKNLVFLQNVYQIELGNIQTPPVKRNSIFTNILKALAV